MAGQPIAKITAGGGTHVIAPSFYATCDTAAATAAKIAKLVDTNVNAATFITGMALWVKFTNANSVANPTLTVQTSGGTEILAAKNIMGYGTTAVSTNAKTSWHSGAIVCFVYDGTNWVETTGVDSNDNTYPSAYCSTAAATAAKAASCSGYILTAKTWLHIIMTNANSVEGAITLNVNGKGAKPIYINGSASSASNYTLPAGSYLVYYNGTNYYFRTDGYLTTTTSVGSASGWSAGTAPGLTITEMSCHEITKWARGTASTTPSWTITALTDGIYADTNKITFDPGTPSTRPTLTATEHTIGSASAWNAGTNPSLTVSDKTVATGIGV